MGWKVAFLLLTLSFLANAIPPGPVKPEYYKDNDGSYNINYKVETDKGLISVRQHHHNLGVVDPVEKPVKDEIPPPAVVDEVEPAPIYPKYVSPRPRYHPQDLPSTQDLVLDPPPIAPKYVTLRRKPVLPLDETYPPPPPSPKYVPPPPPKYVSVKSAYPAEDEDCPPEDGIPPPVPKYDSVRYVSDNSHSPVYGAPKRRPYAPYPELLDRTYEGAKRPYGRSKILSRIVESTNREDDFISAPKEQKDKLYSMGLIYMKNLWGNV